MCGARRYTGQNFDAEFIQTMYQVCRHYIGERQSVSLEDMGDYVREKVRSVLACPVVFPFMRTQWCRDARVSISTHWLVISVLS